VAGWEEEKSWRCTCPFFGSRHRLPSLKAAGSLLLLRLLLSPTCLGRPAAACFVRTVNGAAKSRSRRSLGRAGGDDEKSEFRRSLLA
jgi:hypothetical protein